jgi:hypothetical protein
MNGVIECANAIFNPSGLKATSCPVPVGNVAGFEYLVPNPELLQGYVEINGVEGCTTAIAELLGLKATPNPLSVGKVAGLL